MTKLVFDIETIGIDYEGLDKKSKEYLMKFAETPEDEEEAKDQMSFSPLTGEVVAIGILNPDTNKGAVYFRDPSGKLEKESENNIQYTPLSSEKDISEDKIIGKALFRIPQLGWIKLVFVKILKSELKLIII